MLKSSPVLVDETGAVGIVVIAEPDKSLKSVI